MPNSYARRSNPGTSAFITPMLTTGKDSPVFPSVRCTTGGTEVSGLGLASSKSVRASTLAVPAQRIGFTMNSRRFHFPWLFMAQLLETDSTSLSVLSSSLRKPPRYRLQNLGPILRRIQQCNYIPPLRARDQAPLVAVACPDST